MSWPSRSFGPGNVPFGSRSLGHWQPRRPGGVTPLLLPDDLPVFVDTPIMALERVILGGGGRRLKLRLRPAVLASLEQVTVADIRRPAPA